MTDQPSHNLWQYTAASWQWSVIWSDTEDRAIDKMDGYRRVGLPGVAYLVRPTGWQPSDRDVYVRRKMDWARASMRKGA